MKKKTGAPSPKSPDATADLLLSDSVISPEGEEDIQDVSDIDPENLRELALQASDWTTETILSQVRKGRIDFRPKFQRRGVWTDIRKSLFIESLTLGLPIPQLVLAEHGGVKGHFLVIDGKQRLLSLLHFAQPELGGFETPLLLQGLSLRPELNGKSFTEIQADTSLSKVLASFENQPIRTVVVRNLQNESLLYNIFLRLNTGSVPLSPQELRQALHPGPFVDFAFDYSATSPALRHIFGVAPDFRMRDTELLIRFFAFANFMDTYAGNLKKFLDDTCLWLNERWSRDESKIRAQAGELEQSHKTITSIFGRNAYRKYSAEGYEGRSNRAVFDIMTYYFSRAATRRLVTPTSAKAVRSAYEKLCLNDRAFIEAITSTTKSLRATNTRFESWGKALGRSLKKAIPILKIGQG